jgi:rhodanese-related sulfurtransferase
MRNRARSGPAGIRRVGAEEIRRRLEAGAGVTLIDARHGAAFDEASVQAASAVRYDIDHPDLPAIQVQVKPDGEVIAYCD